MTFLKIVDIFGTSFQFTTYKTNQYKTNIGGLLTLACIIVAIALIALFGRNLFKHENPNVLVDYEFPPEYPFIDDFNNERFLIAFNVTTAADMDINDLVEVYVINHFRNGTGKIHDLDIPYASCADVNITDPLFLYDFNPSRFNCLDLKGNNLTFGGDTDTDYYSLISIYVYPKTGLSYEDLYELTEGEINIDIIHPQHFFDSKSKGVPLGNFYNIHNQQINIGLKKKDKMKVEQVFSIDDIGWMLPDPQYESRLSVNTLTTDYDYFPLEYFTEYNIPMFECSIRMIRSTTTISRSFMKIQDVAAQVTGIINVIILVCRILVLNYNMYDRNRYLFNEIFEYNENGKPKG
jgi:hypothetical protein